MCKSLLIWLDRIEQIQQEKLKRKPRPGPRQFYPVPPSRQPYLGPRRPRGPDFYANRRVKKAIRKLPFWEPFSIRTRETGFFRDSLLRMSRNCNKVFHRFFHKYIRTIVHVYYDTFVLPAYWEWFSIAIDDPDLGSFTITAAFYHIFAHPAPARPSAMPI